MDNFPNQSMKRSDDMVCVHVRLGLINKTLLCHMAIIGISQPMFNIDCVMLCQHDSAHVYSNYYGI